jgi:hypothetical protein
LYRSKVSAMTVRRLIDWVRIITSEIMYNYCIDVLHGFICNSKLQPLWAVPLNFSLIWQWSHIPYHC